ncbi:hypothetical protein ACFB49_16010 [Sphingomonas sp. DBB INV C78]|uniref:hypothetical protein n=1 Tax=Sphingomonas sp. DBB INV C78 TaxID=3349434 RepID=UPI0036D28993
MDLNYLYMRHQISLLRAVAAVSTEARWAHEQLAGRYADVIEVGQNNRPAKASRPANLIRRALNA